MVDWVRLQMQLEMRSENLTTNVMKECNMLTKLSLHYEEKRVEDTERHNFSTEITIIVCNGKCHVGNYVTLGYEAASNFLEVSKPDDQRTTLTPKSTTD
jgi:hypothetical protein